MCLHCLVQDADNLYSLHTLLNAVLCLHCLVQDDLYFVFLHYVQDDLYFGCLHCLVQDADNLYFVLEYLERDLFRFMNQPSNKVR